MLDWNALFSNPATYGVLAGLIVFAWGMVGMIFRPLGIKKNMALLLVGIGFVMTSGLLGDFMVEPDAAALGGKVYITDLQVTTGPDGNCTNSEDPMVDDLINMRCSDHQVQEGETGAEPNELNGTIFTVTRGGALPAASCKVEFTSPRGWESQVTPGDGKSYTLWEVTTKNELEFYIRTSSTNNNLATTSSPKQSATLSFDEGVATGYVSVLADMDEDAHDNLVQYGKIDSTLNICGKKVILRVENTD